MSALNPAKGADKLLRRYMTAAHIRTSRKRNTMPTTIGSISSLSIILLSNIV
jgi:hypothetical protein